MSSVRRRLSSGLRAALCPVLVAAICAFQLPAVGAPSRSSAYWQREAERLYQSGRYLDSVEALKKAREKDKDPTVVFNIARAYEQAAELPDALEHYKLYLDEGDDPTLVRRSQLAIDRIGALLVKQTEAELEKKRLEEEARRAQAEAEAAESERDRLELAELRAREQRDSSAKIGAIAAGGIAVAGLGTGLAFGLLSLGAKSDFTLATTLEHKRELEGTVKSRALIADVGFGVGLAAAVTAFLLYPKGDAPPVFEDEEGLSARILVGPTAAGVEVKF